MTGWVQISFGVLAWLLGAAFSYGILRTKLDEHEKRLNSYGTKLDSRVTREEYDHRHQDMLNRLTKIEEHLWK